MKKNTRSGSNTQLFKIISVMDGSRVRYLLSRETGKPVTGGWKSAVLSQYRCFISVLFVRVQAACLSARIEHLGLQRGSRQEEGSDAAGGKK